MKKLTFREVQLGELQVLKKIKEICQKNNWKFFLSYGSMLGAVRHYGIIPWDDDIDIMMPREDYDKLIQYFIENEVQLLPYKLFCNNTNANYPHMIARISDQRYWLDFENEKDYGIGLFVDIYPIDGVGNDYKQALKYLIKSKRLASLCFLTSRKKIARDNTTSTLKMILKIPAYIWANIQGNKHYIKKIESKIQECNWSNSNLVACAAWPDEPNKKKNKDIFNKEIFDKIKWTKFEDTEMPILEKYDEFLTMVYGDYMAPPPEKDRTTNHTYKAYLI